MSLLHSYAHHSLPQKISGYVIDQSAPQVPLTVGWKSVEPHVYNAFVSSSTGESIPQYSASTGWDSYDSDWGDSGVFIGTDTANVINSQQADLGSTIISPVDSQANTSYGYGGYNG